MRFSINDINPITGLRYEDDRFRFFSENVDAYYDYDDVEIDVEKNLELFDRVREITGEYIDLQLSLASLEYFHNGNYERDPKLLVYAFDLLKDLPETLLPKSNAQLKAILEMYNDELNSDITDSESYTDENQIFLDKMESLLNMIEVDESLSRIDLENKLRERFK